MGMVGVKCSRGFIGMQDHRDCMRDPLHPCSLTEDILEMMTTVNKERVQNGVRFSPSSLMGCHRQNILAFDTEWYVDVEGVAWSQVRGNMVHALMEQGEAWDGILGTVREWRASTPIQTKHGVQMFAGKADLIVLKHIENVNIEHKDADDNVIGNHIEHVLHIKVVDYKSKANIEHGPANHKTDPDRIEEGHAQAVRKHQMQVNLYAWLFAQELPSHLNGWFEDSQEHEDVSLNAPLPHIDRVVVDEIEILYADMNKTRRFTSAGPLQTKGKRTSMSPLTYATLILDPIHLMRPSSVARWIQREIEAAIDAQTVLPAPLKGRAAHDNCFFCPVKEKCIEVGLKEGYDMSEQM